jgi:hypothetical protein
VSTHGVWVPGDEANKVLHLSPSIAAVLLQRSPLHAWQAHSLGGNKRGEVSDEMRRGKLLDRLLFKTGAEIVIVDAKAWNTNVAKAAREQAENEGKIAVLTHQHEAAEAQANAIRALLFDRGIDISKGASQHRVVWASGEGVACKGFLDLLFIGDGGADIYDLKITDDASPSRIKLDMRASLQHAAYVEAIETLHPEHAGRVFMKFIYAEPDEGGDLTIAEPDGQLKALGANRWRRAVATWGECLRTSKFPGYPRDVVRVEAKPWDMDAEMTATIPAGGSPGVEF